ncbi:MAG TPA: DUF6282 family protein [Mycobacteriales bacterium]|nr:DUF6282 family protein [Mycobacteriales bacterium]
MTSIVSALPADFARLTTGALDLHVHGQPDLAAAYVNRGPDLDVVRLAHAYGLRGWVLKSHLWATTDRAALLTEQMAGTGFTVFGSVTLNPPVGGVEPAVVELAAAHGAAVVFLPTWSARADAERGGYIARLLASVAPSFPAYQRATAIELTGPDGRLGTNVREVADACRERGLLLATGHASPAESRAVAEYCSGRGPRLVITHPLDYVDTLDQLVELADLGALIEFPGAPLVHPDARLTVRRTFDAISAVGPHRCVLTTDVFSRWVPPQPEMLRMFAEQLHFLGCAADDIATMVVDNPRRALGLPAPAPAPAPRPGPEDPR